VTLPRFYAPDLDPAKNDAVLPPDESHHLVRVMRLVGGDEVVVFDGRGRECRARVQRADRNAATVVIVEAIQSAPEASVPVTLVQAVLKGDKMDGVVRDATMAGVWRIAPIVTDRTQIGLASLGRAHAQDRWRRVAIASAKQSGRGRLPTIDEPRSLRDWLSGPREGLRLLLLEPSAEARDARSLRSVLSDRKPETVSCVVGPEGGWSVGELKSAVDGGCVPVTLGSMTLRADAVGLVAVSLIRFALEDGA
jgi:16S rRNA (uracil1498-N3)-methyltransferase